MARRTRPVRLRFMAFLPWTHRRRSPVKRSVKDGLASQPGSGFLIINHIASRRIAFVDREIHRIQQLRKVRARERHRLNGAKI